ncbi:TraL conjugative transposon family protein [Prevotella disiens]|uniref:TraL conjugative transposon family protein n=1 Tax=Prevotella disiens TaxID=28130 RepID=UPI002889B7BD|nr:TraL conjugative transposon family protein [Prevotella disiens]
MKKKRVFQKVREEINERLRRLCGRIPLYARLYVVLTMLAVFAILSNYLFFQGIYHIFFEERGNERNIPAIEHIETPEVKRLYPNDSINPLKYYDYVPIQKKDSFRREYLA